MKFQHTSVMNFENAFRGLRNPLESWAKSDSFFGLIDQYNEQNLDTSYLYIQHEQGIDIEDERYDEYEDKYVEWLSKNGILEANYDDGIYKVAYIGPKDLDLAHRMIKAGSSDRKFLRQIFVSVDITAPLYWY